MTEYGGSERTSQRNTVRSELPQRDCELQARGGARTSDTWWPPHLLFCAPQLSCGGAERGPDTLPASSAPADGALPAPAPRARYPAIIAMASPGPPAGQEVQRGRGRAATSDHVAQKGNFNMIHECIANRLKETGRR